MKKEHMIIVCKEIQKDMESNAMSLDGKPFDGKTMATQFGYQCAAVRALAGIVEKMLEQEKSHE